ncbi:methyltransferase domain-containing protein [Methanoculleus sp. DTU007]|jgi:tRNA (guanine10-N2)-dimethyltransferase|uniref:methyltransferase domain-containing protein n=1 Tax=Methanoculleus TaxID=45989 RepID=UPI000B1BEBBA|nr:methyltransferase domain-containing protein [Methanoculleus sp. DTU007]NLN09222.1 methyltransferase domain-containing protein [Methanoculleus thermophilus]HQD26065.1 methyltransferase domain-containing protein [Methanoculleus thermophilus]
MKLLFELSGEHPDLPVAELECVGTVLDRRIQVAVAECPDPGAARRLALTHVVMEYLGECEPTHDAFVSLLRDLAIQTEKPFAGRVKMIQGSRMDVARLEVERLIGSLIVGPVSLREPVEEYRAVVSEDRCYFGRVIMRIDRGAFDVRNPMRRPFFHPGVMMPRMARALVNISLAAPGDWVYDPFCGTGGILLEAREIGARILGSDFDPAMVAGYRQNLPNSDVLIADATAVPVCDHAIDAVVTDLPYGQSVRIRAESMDRLYDGSLAEIRRILKPGRRAIVVTHRDITDIAARHFTVLQEHEQRVHKSLTRRILVLA